MPAYDRNSLQGRQELDAPPAPPRDRIKPMPLPPAPGDDTMSLLGAPNVNGEGVGVSADSPTGRALKGVMKMMQGANDIESVIPGAVPPPLQQLIQQLMVTIPEIVRSMQQQMTGPGGMLSSIGMGSMGAGAPTPGMGMGEGPQMPPGMGMM